MSGLRLNANENLWGPSRRVTAALRKFHPAVVASYPDSDLLTQSLSRRLRVSRESLVLTNGADEAIYGLIALRARSGGRLVMPVPGFREYAHAARLNGIDVRGIPLGPRFEFRLTDMLRAIEKTTALVVLISPNNPTGTTIKGSDLVSVICGAERLDVPVLLDETYAGFQSPSRARLIRRHRNLIVVGSFSKYFALAGLRLGYAAADPEIISALRKMLPPYSVNAAALLAGQAALESDPYYERVRRAVVRRRTELALALRSSGLTVFPSKANFLCVRVEPDALRVAQRLASAGVFVKSFPDEPRLSDCLRITVGKPADNLRLAAALEEARSPQALIFDMDGVLIDVSASYRRAIQRTVFRFSGTRVSPADIEAFKLRPEMNNDWDVASAILDAAGYRVPRARIISAFQGFYLGTAAFPGCIRSERWLLPPRVLRRLTARYRLGIVTGRPGAEVRLALGRFRTGAFFETVVSREDMGARQKPDPFGLRLALKRLGAGRAVYFGDGVADMAAARAIGLPSVAVRPPGMSDDSGWRLRMKEAGARRFCDNLVKTLEDDL